MTYRNLSGFPSLLIYIDISWVISHNGLLFSEKDSAQDSMHNSFSTVMIPGETNASTNDFPA